MEIVESNTISKDFTDQTIDDHIISSNKTCKTRISHTMAQKVKNVQLQTLTFISNSSSSLDNWALFSELWTETKTKYIYI